MSSFSSSGVGCDVYQEVRKKKKKGCPLMITNGEGTDSPVSDFCLQRSALECSLLDKGEKIKYSGLSYKYVPTWSTQDIEMWQDRTRAWAKKNQEYLRILLIIHILTPTYQYLALWHWDLGSGRTLDKRRKGSFLGSLPSYFRIPLG